MHATKQILGLHFRNRSRAGSWIKLFAVLISITMVVAVEASRPGHTFFSQSDVSASRYQNGAAIYARSCARCHGSDGRAQTAKGKAVDAVDFTSDDWQPDFARDVRIVTKGKGNMPTFKRTLKPAEIQAVVTYIRGFKR